MAAKALEQRIFNFDIRADEPDQNGIAILTGRPIVYNSRTDLGYMDEIIDSGALNETDLTDVRFLVNHDTSMIPLARSRKNTPNSTMQLMPDMEGLAIRVNLDVANNDKARSLYSAVSRGDITGMSFMFGIDDEEWENLDSDHPLRRIKKISTVVEVSAVTFPAYEATEINARSLEALENARLALENARSADINAKRSVETELEVLKLQTESLFLGR